MALLDEIRQKNPSLANRSDDEIKSLIRTSPEFQYFSDDEFNTYVSGKPAQQADSGTPGFISGLAAGVDQMQAMGGGLVMAAGEAMESEGLLDYGRDVYQRNMAEADENALGYGFTDIRSPGEAFNWARYTAGNLLPMMAGSVAGGGIGGVVAGGGAKLLAGAAAREGAKRAGQALGAAGASAGMETGALMGETEDLDVSLAHGVLAGSLDALVPIKLLRSAGKSELADQAATEISDRVLSDLRRTAGQTTRGTAARGSLTGMMAEASTEGLQGLINQHANYWIENNGESLLANLGEVDVKALVDEAAAGGLMGGIVGAPTGLGERSQARNDLSRIESAREQVAQQGGDALSQTVAAQSAEQLAESERPAEAPLDPAVSAEVGNRLQLAMGELDDLQSIARGSSYQGQTRLRNISTILDRAERAFEEGNVAQAQRLTERAEGIASNLRNALNRAGTRERPMEGQLAEQEAAQQPAGLIGQDSRRLPPGDPSTIYAEGPTADQTQYDPQARNVRRDERMAAQQASEARMREQATAQRPQLTDSGTIYGQGPTAGNANTGMDQPSADPRFRDDTVHTMPDGSTMAGPEHQGAVPGTTRQAEPVDTVDTSPGRVEETAENRQEDLQYRTNGQPFASERVAMASGFARNAQRQGQSVEAVKVPGGFALSIRSAANALGNSRELAAETANETALEALRELFQDRGRDNPTATFDETLENSSPRVRDAVSNDASVREAFEAGQQEAVQDAEAQPAPTAAAEQSEPTAAREEPADTQVAPAQPAQEETASAEEATTEQTDGEGSTAETGRTQEGAQDDTEFSLGERENTTDPLPTVEEVKAALEGMPELGDVEVVLTTSRLPTEVLTNMHRMGVSPVDVKGVHHNGKTYVVAIAHDNVGDAVRTAVHEAVGHKGMRGVLGEDLDRVMLGLYRSLPNTPEGRQALAEVRSDYDFLDPSKRRDRITIAEEMVAHLLEKGHRPKAWQRAVAKIRDLLRRAFPMVGWTYTDVLALGEQSREWLRSQQRSQSGNTSIQFSKAPSVDGAAFKRWFGDEGVRDADGEPAIFYHGGREGFTTIDGEKGRFGGIFILEGEQSGYNDQEFELYFKGPVADTDDIRRFFFRAEDGGKLVIEKALGFSVTDAELDSIEQAVLDEGWADNAFMDAIGEIDIGDAYAAMQKIRGAIAREQGFTGVNVHDEFSGDAILVVDPLAIKSATDNQGTYDPDNADIRFSLRGKKRSAFEEQFSDFTDADKAAAAKIGSRTPPQRAVAWFKEHADRAGLKIRQGIVDKHAALKELDEKLYGESALGENIQRSSWVLARMSNAANGALHAMLHNGRIRLDPKEKVIQLQDDDSKGLGSVLGQLGSAAEIERFMGWIAGNRADRLAQDGRENLFEIADIEAMKTWNRGTMADGRSRGEIYREVFDEFQAYRDDVLAVAEQSGIISKDQREMWGEEFYVPFYRLSEEKGAPTGQMATSGLSRQQAYKQLKGGTQNLNDLLQNTMMNFHHLLDASLKNQAAVQAVENAKQLGMVEKVSESTPSKSKTFVMENGQKAFYQIDDPLVFQALTALAHPGMNSTAMKVMRTFKRVFTNLTTTTPQFMVANLIRDSLQASATNNVSKNAFKNIVVGAQTYRDERLRAQMMASGASFNFGHLYGTNPDELRAQMTRDMRNAKIVDGPYMVPGMLRAGWNWWNDVNNTAENLNRAAIYAENRDQGELRAAFEARDLIDFSSHGAWPAVRILIDIVPFLNARIQGLDKIYRSGVKPGASVIAEAFGKGKANVTDKQAAARFWTVAGALATATIALYLHNHDDEEYQKLEDWQKDTYWFIRFGDQAFFIPKPFEVGAIATMAERITEQFVDDQATGKLFRQRLMHMMTDTFSFSPIPQAVQPALDIYANRDSFRDRPIEGMGMDRLSPELRRRSSTTGLAQVASNVLNSTVGAIGNPDTNPLALSPVQVDHLIQGYLGQVGAWAAASGDVAWNAMTGKEDPARHFYEYQPIRRFYKNLGDEDRYTKYGTVFYDGLREAGRAYADVKEMREMGRLADAADAARTNREMLALRKPLNRAQTRLRRINQQIDIIRRSDLDGELKRERIDRLNVVKNQIQRALGERVLEARSS